MIESLNSLSDFLSAVDTQQALLLYFSNEDCSICKVLKPKVMEFISQRFPKIKMYYIDIRKTPEIAGQNFVFAVPTILVYFSQRELFRLSQNFGLAELEDRIQKPYLLSFEQKF